MDGRGFDEHNWDALKVLAGRCAAPHDVDTGAAVFALGDTLNGRPLDWMLPQPVIWYHEDEEFAAVVVQAESHETETGETLEALGLVLPTGKTAIAFTEDVEEVDAVDPTWVALVKADLDPIEDDEDDDVLDEDEASGEDEDTHEADDAVTVEEVLHEAEPHDKDDEEVNS